MRSRPAASSEYPGEDPVLDDLLEEIAQRLERNEPVEIESYVQAHPHYAERLQRVFPAMKALAELGNATGSDAASFQPRLLGEYRLEREVGRGGMGIVYEARQMSTGRRVAVKVLPCVGTPKREQLRRFKNEALAIAGLDHPNIVPVYSVGCEQGVYYYAMRLVEGRTLAHVIGALREAAAADHPQAADKEPFQPILAAPFAGCGSHHDPEFVCTVVSIAIQIADALDHAHRQGVIHRDIKPSNLLLDGTGHIWIADFGVARVEGNTRITLTGEVPGTLRYMSPEQALAKGSPVDRRSDIYSLAATLYELLTLRPVCDGVDRQEVLQQIARVNPPSLQRVNRDVPRDLETIVLKSLAKHPDDRYATAAELSADLRLLLEGQPIHARQPSLTQRLTRWTQRHQQALTVALVLLAVTSVSLGIATLFVLRERDRAEVQRVEAVEQRLRAERNFLRARRAVDDCLVLLSERALIDMPGSQPLRKKILDTALRYYESFVEQHADDAQLQVELVSAYLRVAQINRASGQGSWLKPLNRALDLLETLSEQNGPLDRLEASLADVLHGGDYLHATEPHPPDPQAARQTLGRAVDVWERLVRDHPQVAVFQHSLAHLYLYLGEAAAGDQSIAIPALHRARGLFQRLVRDHPDTAPYRAGLASTYWVLGRMWDRRQPREAESSYRKALDGYEALVRDHPETVRYQHELAESRRTLAALLAGAGRSGEAAELFRKAASCWERLSRDYPRVPIYRERLALCHSGLGNLAARSDPRHAEPHLLESIKQFESLVAEYPDVPSYQMRLFLAYRYLGSSYQADNNSRQAVEAFSKAGHVIERAVQRFPKTPRFRVWRARHDSDLADGLIEADRWEDAEKVGRRAVARIRAIHGPDDPRLAAIWNQLAGILHRLGKESAAETARDEAQEVVRRINDGALVPGPANNDTMITLELTNGTAAPGHPGVEATFEPEALLPGQRRLAGVLFHIPSAPLIVGSSTATGTPAAITLVDVNRPLDALHFLHNAMGRAPTGAVVGQYRVHYRDGSEEVIRVAYGRHVHNWTDSPTPLPPASRLAWMGRNLAANGERQLIHLNVTTWRNPRPQTPVRSIAIAAPADSPAALCCVAITASIHPSETASARQ